MAYILLNDLELLPAGAAVCIVGAGGRSSRFIKVLHQLRPDITITGSFPLADPDWLSTADFVRKLPQALQVTDLVLTTLCKSRQYLQIDRLLKHWKGIGLFVVNPNFYHPFLQLSEAAEVHLEKLRAVRNALPYVEDRAIYDLAARLIRPKSNLQEECFMLTELYARMGRQYFDHINRSAVERIIIEGGIADGWVTMQLLGSFPKSTVYGFDPDSELFQKSYHRQFLQESGRFHYSPLGLWEKRDRRPFAVGKACSSCIAGEAVAAAQGNIDTISIDEFVTCNNILKVDFIKLDIEGSELSALRGAKHTISKHRPQLAVCLYHRLEHYYEIPSLLFECALDYILRIGHYSPFHVFSETVMYAIPRELYNSHQF